MGNHFYMYQTQTVHCTPHNPNRRSIDDMWKDFLYLLIQNFHQYYFFYSQGYHEWNSAWSYTWIRFRFQSRSNPKLKVGFPQQLSHSYFLLFKRETKLFLFWKVSIVFGFHVPWSCLLSCVLISLSNTYVHNALSLVRKEIHRSRKSLYLYSNLKIWTNKPNEKCTSVSRCCMYQILC